MAGTRQIIKILLVEDSPGDVRLIREVLKGTDPHGFRLVQVDRASAALERISNEAFDVVLLDLSLPDSLELEALKRVKTHAPQLPVVILTGLDDERLAIRAVQEGAQDYIVKGRPDGPALGRALRYAIERNRAGDRLAYDATHDFVTDLPNRNLLRDRLEGAVQRARRSGHGAEAGRLVAVLMIDLDGFKDVNDTWGHARGDEVLRAVARRLRACVRRVDTVARQGGDEFTVVLEDIAGRADAQKVAEKILRELRRPYRSEDRTEGDTCTLGASIGISIFPEDAEDPDGLMRTADLAMYEAKKRGNSFAPTTETPREERPH